MPANRIKWKMCIVIMVVITDGIEAWTLWRKCLIWKEQKRNAARDTGYLTKDQKQNEDIYRAVGVANITRSMKLKTKDYNGMGTEGGSKLHQMHPRG